MPGVDHLDLAVGQVQPHRQGGDELLTAELLEQLTVSGCQLRYRAAAGAAGVAHHRGRQAGEHTGLDPATHRVQAAQVQMLQVDVVVIAVPAHLIGRDQLADHGELAGAERPQRLQVPLHLRRDAKRLGPPGGFHHIRARPARHQHTGGRQRHLSQPEQQTRLHGLLVEQHPQHPQALSAKRQPEPAPPSRRRRGSPGQCCPVRPPQPRRPTTARGVSVGCQQFSGQVALLGP